MTVNINDTAAEPSGTVTFTPENDSGWRSSFRRKLANWYEKSGRDLPWRRTRDPYAIWVSEVMLQQTTVAAVIPYYERFLNRFPTVRDLAASSEHDVLKLWEGLGYYSRARNLRSAAARIVEVHGGEFPKSVGELRKLAGIGRYTAGAIASFAFEIPAPIVEANTLRLYSRLVAWEDDPRSTAGQKRLWDFAERIVPKSGASRFNHAVMDLGATVCVPDRPRCDVCPVAENCLAYGRRIQNRLPRPRPRTPFTDVTEAYVVIERNGCVLLRRRAPGERWAGLWDFPRYELTEQESAAIPPSRPTSGQKSLPLSDAPPLGVKIRLERLVDEQCGIKTEVSEPFAELRHGVTRFRIRVICFRGTASNAVGSLADGCDWFSSADLTTPALTTPARRLAKIVASL